MNKLLSAFALDLISAAMLTSCCKDDSTPTPFDPEKVVIDYDALSASAVTEFLNFAKTPRLGFHLEQAQEYLQNWAKSHGYQPTLDKAGNVYFDVPATAGLEDYPKIILQGHIDMICASGPGEKYDYTKVVGEPYYEGDLLKGKKVNLGADDGSGVGTALAIVASDVPHGPLRILITANEDYDMSGAKNIEPDVLDANSLINIDSEEIGVVTYGCAGGVSNTFTKQCEAAILTEAERSQYKKVSLSVEGLRGGHSGVDIGDKTRLSGSVVTDSIIRKVVQPVGARLISIDCGKYDNAIPTFSKMTFAVKNEDVAAVESKLNALCEYFKMQFPKETKAEWSVDVTGSLTDKDACSVTSCTADYATLLKEIEQGVIEVNSEGRTTKSNNIGVVNLQVGKIRFTTFCRSDYDEWLDSEKLRHGNIAEQLSMKIEDASSFPAWNGDGKDKLTQMVLKYYQEDNMGSLVMSYGKDEVPEEDEDNMGKLEKTLGGLEPAYFVHKNTNLKCTSIGPTINNAHSIDEALYVSTMKPLMKVTMKTLLHAKDL